MKNLFPFCFAISLASCELAPKALVIAEEPKPTRKQQPQPVVTQIPPSSEKEDGLRMPDMLTLPDDGQLRSASPETSGDAAVIVRPPAE